MPRPTYPPYDFSCPYTHACPHMHGLSTTWVMEIYHRSHDVYQEQLRIIDSFDGALKTRDAKIRALEKLLAELHGRYLALHQKQFKPNRKKSNTPPDAKPNPDTDKTVKKRGAPIGHPGWYRPTPDKIDRTFTVPPPLACPHCRAENLLPLTETTEHIQEDIVLECRPRATQYRHGLAYCPRCRRAVMQAAPDEIPHAPIGPVAKSVALFLRYRIGVPYRKVQTILHDLFGLACVPASLVGFDRTVVHKASAIYDDLREKIRSSAVVHADETSWRNDGLGHYVWYAGNDDLAFFHIDRHRSADVAKAIFGPNFSGILVRDRYAAYNDIGIYQSCLAHIITRARELIREHALLPDQEKHSAVEPFLTRLIDLCSRACGVGQKLKAGDILWEQSSLWEKRFVRELRKICSRRLAFKPAETLRSYLIGPEQPYLFTFLRHPGVSPTNNQAEQSLRHMVIFRKLSFGTRSTLGLKTHSIIPSLIKTARRQGVHPRGFLQILLTADHTTAQAALYHNSS